MPEPAHNPIHAPGQVQPTDLEARIAALEGGAAGSDFDAMSWFWMILIGVAIPILLLAIGWWA